MKRYVIRISGTDMYYTGHNTFGLESNIFSEFSKSKVFKNVGGTKVACGDLTIHTSQKNLEIVEIETIITDNVIKYE